MGVSRGDLSQGVSPVQSFDTEKLSIRFLRKVRHAGGFLDPGIPDAGGLAVAFLYEDFAFFLFIHDCGERFMRLEDSIVFLAET